MKFTFTNNFPISRVDEVVSYILGPRLWILSRDYPDILNWAEKAHQELKRQSKRVMVALDHNQIIGATVYQCHKQKPGALELKNITVRPEARGRYIASFLLRNTEIEGQRDFGSSHILLDTKATNFAIRFFLTKHRYQRLEQLDLYRLGAGEDVVYRKDLTRLAA